MLKMYPLFSQTLLSKCITRCCNYTVWPLRKLASKPFVLLLGPWLGPPSCTAMSLQYPRKDKQNNGTRNGLFGHFYLSFLAGTIGESAMRAVQLDTIYNTGP